MTEVVVTDNKSTVLVSADKVSTVVTDVQQPQVIVTGIMGPAGARDISSMSDTDLSNLEDGSLLAYSSSTSTWVATRLLEQQIIESGQF